MGVLPHGADVGGGGAGGGGEDDEYDLVHYLRRMYAVGPFDTAARYCNRYKPAPGSVETDNAVNPNIHNLPYIPTVGYIPADRDLFGNKKIDYFHDDRFGSHFVSNTIGCPRAVASTMIHRLVVPEYHSVYKSELSNSMMFDQQWVRRLESGADTLAVDGCQSDLVLDRVVQNFGLARFVVHHCLGDNAVRPRPRMLKSRYFQNGLRTDFRPRTTHSPS